MHLGWEVYLDVARLGHIFAGITWIGLLYYFNFVQTAAFPKMDPAARSNAVQLLVPRALLWFRWAALATLLFGGAYIVGAEYSNANADYWSSFRFRSITIGGTMGVIMAINVWAIIWPYQKKIIAATTAMAKDGTPAPADQPKWARRALLASRTNTLLSIPMLFFMVGAIHLPSLWS